MVSKTQMRGSVVPLGLVCLLIEAWVGLLCRVMSVTRTSKPRKRTCYQPGRIGWQIAGCQSFVIHEYKFIPVSVPHRLIYRLWNQSRHTLRQIWCSRN